MGVNGSVTIQWTGGNPVRFVGTESTIDCEYFAGQRSSFYMGVGSIALLCLTISIGLMQWPGAQAQAWVLPAQSLMAFARNVTLFAVVLGDVR